MPSVDLVDVVDKEVLLVCLEGAVAVDTVVLAGMILKPGSRANMATKACLVQTELSLIVDLRE